MNGNVIKTRSLKVIFTRWMQATLNKAASFQNQKEIQIIFSIDRFVLYKRIGLTAWRTGYRLISFLVHECHAFCQDVLAYVEDHE